jgi:hypothetical protein
MSKDAVKARKVTDDVWIFSRLLFRPLSHGRRYSQHHSWISRPFTRFGILPLGGRSVAVKLSHGGVWVLASTPPTEETKAAIDGLGLVCFRLHSLDFLIPYYSPVSYIVSPNTDHHWFLGTSAQVR